MKASISAFPVRGSKTSTLKLSMSRWPLSWNSRTFSSGNGVVPSGLPPRSVMYLLTLSTVSVSSSRYSLSGEPWTKRMEGGGAFLIWKLCTFSTPLETSFRVKSGMVTGSPATRGRFRSALLADSARSGVQSRNPAACASPQSVSPSCAVTTVGIRLSLFLPRRRVALGEPDLATARLDAVDACAAVAVGGALGDGVVGQGDLVG